MSQANIIFVGRTPEEFDYPTHTSGLALYGTDAYYGVDFYAKLNRDRYPLWIATFTASIRAPLSCKVERLIRCYGGFPAVEARRLSSHAKLYIQRDKNKTVGVYIGSLNLVAPTTNELMVRVNSKQAQALTKVFLAMWKDAQRDN